MPVRHRLDAEQRDYFERVTKFCYGNPYSLDRGELINRILVASGREPNRDPYAIALGVADRLAPFDADGPARLDQFPERDRDRMEAAFAWLAYTALVDEMDAFIAAEAAAGDTLVLPFHDRYFALMTERGFDEETATLYLGFFFQLRRTFYFIERALPGSSRVMAAFREALWNNVLTYDRKIYATRVWRRMEDFSTLLLGETGTGKGSAAAAIGQSGFIPYDVTTRRFQASFTRSFVSLNLCQFPESLLESELFGHRKGAFTGAIADRDGALARCSEFGALFLDEIGEVDVPVQVKLLQVLQERTYTPVGHTEARRFPGRVIAATNRSIESLRSEGGFRDDFYYRLCSDVIEVPTLRDRVRDRPEELDELAGVIVERTVGERDERLATLVTDSLRRDLPAAYPWPGNVRELEQAVRRVLLTGGCRQVDAGVRKPPTQADSLWQAMREGALQADEVVGRYCAMLFAEHGVYTRVAEITGLDRRTVRKHVDRYLGEAGKPVSD